MVPEKYGPEVARGIFEEMRRMSSGGASCLQTLEIVRRVFGVDLGRAKEILDEGVPDWMDKIVWRK